MKKFRLINLFIYINGLLIFNFLPIFSTKIFAKDVKEKNLSGKINSAQFEQVGIQKSIDISIGILGSKNEVIEDLKSNGDALLNFLAFGQKNFEDDFFVEIDADIQYRDKEIFYAEGDAIIYLSDATLSGDLVKYNLQNKILTVVGNVIFKKGEQYFEASELTYNVKEDTGYINDVYGLLDSKTFADDFKLELNKKRKNYKERKK